MGIDRTSNPVLKDKIFENVRTSPTTEVMTINGTVNKTLISLAITAGVAWWTASDPTMIALAMPAGLIGFVVALIVSFKPAWAPALTPVYAAVQGCFLGAISLMFETMYHGIVLQAVTLTFGTLFVLLMAYKSGYIKATPALNRGVITATFAIFLFYVGSMLFSVFGLSGGERFIAGSSPMSIGLSVVIVIVAALNLVLDFGRIESAAQEGNTPKYMEWYGAFALLVTLIWLYLEILRLLSKLQSRN